MKKTKLFVIYFIIQQSVLFSVFENIRSVDIQISEWIDIKKLGIPLHF